ncbi:MAG: LamG-like jellyroll fold domain-containing protein, partial [Chloroflexota bacterium]
ATWTFLPGESGISLFTPFETTLVDDVRYLPWQSLWYTSTTEYKLSGQPFINKHPFDFISDTVDPTWADVVHRYWTLREMRPGVEVNTLFCTAELIFTEPSVGGEEPTETIPSPTETEMPLPTETLPAPTETEMPQPTETLPVATETIPASTAEPTDPAPTPDMPQQTATPIPEPTVPVDGPDPNFALHFDGADDYLYVEGRLELDFGFSAEAWIYRDKISEDGDEVVMSGEYVFLAEDEIGAEIWKLFLIQAGSPSGSWGVELCDLTRACIMVNSQSSLPIETWHHLAFSYDGDTVRLYQNGDEVGQATNPETNVDVMNRLLVGDRTQPIDGIVDEVRIWNLIKDGEQMWEAASRPLTGDEIGLIGLWPFPEGVGQATQDQSPSKLIGRLGGASLVDDRDPQWVEVADLAEREPLEIYRIYLSLLFEE